MSENSSKIDKPLARKIKNYSQSVDRSTQKQKNHLASKKLRKRRQEKKPRQNDWTRLADDWEDLDYHETERIMPRGTEEKRRQVEKLSAKIALRHEGSEIALPDGVQGVVFDVFSGGCTVIVDGASDTLRCSLRGTLLERDTGFSNAVAVGDRVVVSLADDGQGVVQAVLPRRGVLARPDSHNPHLQQILAANIDQVVIVASWREPHFWPELVDRYLVAASQMGLSASLCVNKRDLVETVEEYEAVLDAYRRSGMPVLETSALTGKGIETLREVLSGKTSVVAGLSGAGKSTLLNAVQPGLRLRTGEVGTRGLNTNQGRHTTTQASYHALESGGAVVDTPGIREFGLVGLNRGNLADHYPEMAALSSGCRYSDCAHVEEEGCAVKQGVQSGEIAPIRYDSYRKIYESLEEAPQ